MFISEITSYSIYFKIIEPIGYANATNPTPFMQHTMYSIFLATTAIFLLGRLLYEKNIKYKIIYLLFFLSVTINLFINAGRTGQIAFLISLSILYIYKYKLTIKTILFSTLSIIIVFYSAYNLSPNFKTRMHAIQNNFNKIVDKNDYKTSIGIRVGFWIVTKEIFLDSPILGVGTANHLNKMRTIIDNRLPFLSLNKHYVHFHNQYLEILAQLGLVGLSIFLYFLYSIINIAIIDNEIILLKIGVMSAFILGLFTDNLLWLNMTIMLFSFILGILLAQNRYESNKPQF
jgi:O-antigen ligase